MHPRKKPLLARAIAAVPLLKICGLRHTGQAAQVAALGVDAIGVIAVPTSPRYVPPAPRPALFEAVAAVRPFCLGVLVVADPSDEQMDELRPGRGHRVVQLHGNESVERCDQLRQDLGCLVWKALRIRSPRDLERAAAYAEVVDALLLDAWVADQLGGTGQALPIDWLIHFAPRVPWWLAGGLTPERVPSLLNRLRPDGLDVSSGVEDSPGEKNLKRVAELVEAVRGEMPVLPPPP